MNNRTRYILYGIGALILIFLVWFFSSIVTYIILSAVLATIGRPLVRWLSNIKIGKFKLGSTVSALVTLAFMWIICFLFFRLMIPIFISKFQYLGTIDLQSFMIALEEPIAWITNILYGEPLSVSDENFMSLTGDKLMSFFQASKISGMLGTIAGTIGSVFIALFSISFITFFFLREEGSFQKGLMLLVPTGYEERVEKSLNSVSKLLNRYFIGIILEVFIVMALDTIGLMILGLGFSDSLVIGLICGLFNVIPYLGPWIGATIGVLIGIAIHINADFMEVVLPLVGLMIIVFVAVQIIDNVLLQPLIYSSSVKAHPLEIFLVIMAAGSLAGVVGMIVAIPSYTIIRVFAAEFLSNMKIVRKITEHLDKK
jgi:predicted PurR-regulated permease PerM